MTDIEPWDGGAGVPGRRDLDPEPEKSEWLRELSVLRGATGLSLKNLAAESNCDRSTVWRYFVGKTIPPDRNFLDCLLRLTAKVGQARTLEVKEHLYHLQLRALKVKRPGEARALQLSDNSRMPRNSCRKHNRIQRG